MKITVEPPTPQEIHPPLPSPTPPPPLDLTDKPTFPRKPPRRKSKISGHGVRLKRETSRKGTRPETPLLGWKFHASTTRNDSPEDDRSTADARRKTGRRLRPVDSARKLAAGLWRLHLPEFEPRIDQKLQLQPGGGSIRGCNVDRKKHYSPANNLVHNPLYMSVTEAGIQHKLEPSFEHILNPAMEGATKWDPITGRTSEEPRKVHGRRKISDAPAISALERQLEQARSRINELEMERTSSKKKLEQFLQKVSEDRAEWRSREHEKIRAIIDDMKTELSREKKNRQRLEVVNSKLVNELADAKVSVKRALQEYEKERKARELTEEVCDELAKEIGEDKAEAESIKRESRKILEEVEEERKMLQIAEVWREERVQMKLVDAKVMLEEKYSYMNRILTDLDAFLSSRSANLNDDEIKKLELLRGVAASINMQDVRELKYEPPDPDDMFSAFEDVNFGQSNEQEIEPEPENSCSPASRDSKFYAAEAKLLNKERGERRSSVYMDRSDEDASEWETVSHPENEGSSYSPDESDASVNKSFRETPATEVSEMGSVQPSKLKKASSISRLWRSHTSNGEGTNRRIVNGRLSNGAITSSPGFSGKGEYSPRDLAGRWSLHDAGDSRGMKGCIEWPRGAQRSSLKARLIEARMDGQKTQLRHILKQKI
ncbi:uncharacterized protein At5g41620-like [Andrographis paniculata]|uniref:uncharacterized protein At5g41620-like n=1 Tax=Andrographis paniculata TaxID=175694 RepID=UPI0021E92A9A|nr:uncharacterized protein At5g41620-like [Andrographis paniculata]